MHSWINSYLNLNPVRSVKRRVLAISMTTTAEISSTFAMVTWSRITSASCVYSVTTASMHMLFCQTLSFLIPAMACSSFFVLRVLAEFFAHLHTVEQICERYNISENQLRKWISLWKLHKEQWLGLLNDSETSDLALLKRLCSKDKFSSFSQEFTLHMSHTFLQSHRNPILKRPANARYHQHVFAQDYDIW